MTRLTKNSCQVVRGTILRETDKAYRFRFEHPGHVLNGETFWLPVSQVRVVTHLRDGGGVELEVADWLIERKAEECYKSPGEY